MTTREMSTIAAESPETDVERQQCKDRLAVLETGLRDLKILDKHRPGSGSKSPMLA